MKIACTFASLAFTAFLSKAAALDNSSSTAVNTITDSVVHAVTEKSIAGQCFIKLTPKDPAYVPCPSGTGLIGQYQSGEKVSAVADAAGRFRFGDLTKSDGFAVHAASAKYNARMEPKGDVKPNTKDVSVYLDPK